MSSETRTATWTGNLFIHHSEQSNIPVSWSCQCLQCLCLQCFDAVGWAACKKQWWGAGVVICLERGADMAQLMPLPLTVSCSSKNPDWFYLSGTGLPRLSWKRGRQTGVVVWRYREQSVTCHCCVVRVAISSRRCSRLAKILSACSTNSSE